MTKFITSLLIASALFSVGCKKNKPAEPPPSQQPAPIDPMPQQPAPIRGPAP